MTPQIMPDSHQGEMDARTRFCRTHQFAAVDRFCVGHMGHWPETLTAWLEQGLGPEEQSTIHGNDPAGSMGVVLGSSYTSPFWPRFERRTIEETDEHITELDEHGRLKQWRRDGRPELARWLRFPVETADDWAELKPRMDPRDETRYAHLPELARRFGGQNGRDFPVYQHICGPYRMLWLTFGDVGLGYALYDQPDLVQDVLATWLALIKASLARILDVIDLDHVALLEDICFRDGLMISPRHFRRFILPCYQELTQFLSQFPSVVSISVDSDGDVAPLIPLLLEGGVNTLMPFEVQAGNDVVKIRQQYGERLVIRGGIDKLAIARGPAAIDAELHRVLPFFAASGGYIVCLDHQAHPEIALNDYRYYVNRVKSWPAEKQNAS